MASRKEQKEALRAERERLAEQSARAERHRRIRGYALGGLIAAAAVAIVVAAVTSSGGGGAGSSKGVSTFYPRAAIPPPKKHVSLAASVRAADCKLLTHPSEGHDHTTDSVKYKTDPPSSGNHDPVPVSDGIYTSAPGIGHLVHALEHGRVIIWFKPSTPPRVRGQLKAVFDEDPRILILTPNETGMPYEVAASAWSGNRFVSPPPPEFGHVLGCPRANDAVPQALRAFIAAFRAKGPERFGYRPE